MITCVVPLLNYLIIFPVSISIILIIVPETLAVARSVPESFN